MNEFIQMLEEQKALTKRMEAYIRSGEYVEGSPSAEALKKTFNVKERVLAALPAKKEKALSFSQICNYGALRRRAATVSVATALLRLEEEGLATSFYSEGRQVKKYYKSELALQKTSIYI